MSPTVSPLAALAAVKSPRTLPGSGQREYKTGIRFVKSPAGSTELPQDCFEGHGAVFGNVDSYGDVIEAGAFAKTLDFYLERGTICWQHDWTTPIGKPQLAYEDEKGLFVRGKISQTVAGKDALVLLRDDVLQELSIGYIVEASRTLSDEEGVELLGEAGYAQALRDLPWYADGIRVLTQIKLYEVSLVTVAANDQALVTGVKNNGSLLAGLRAEDAFNIVLAAEEEYLDRVKSIQTLRRKAGRMLSQPNVEKLSVMRASLMAHVDCIDGMLEKNDPAGDEDDDDPKTPGADEDDDTQPKGQTPAARKSAEPGAGEPAAQAGDGAGAASTGAESGSAEGNTLMAGEPAGDSTDVTDVTDVTDEDTEGEQPTDNGRESAPGSETGETATGEDNPTSGTTEPASGDDSKTDGESGTDDSDSAVPAPGARGDAEKTSAPMQARKEWLRFLKTEARLNGVAV